jgi:hypothetical protein
MTLGATSFDSPTAYAGALATFLSTDARAQPFIGYRAPSLEDSARHLAGQVLSEESDRPLADRLAELGWDDVVAEDAPTALRTLCPASGPSDVPLRNTIPMAAPAVARRHLTRNPWT